jgi:transcriptional regulator with XRE-family HTH domain
MDDLLFVSDLARKLRQIRRERLATQQQMEDATGVPQETISKVIHLKRRRRSAALIALDNYANMLLKKKGPVVSPEVTDAVAEFLSVGSEADLIASIKMCANLASGRPVPRN